MYTKYTPDMVDTPAHQQLALEASQQGFVLLQNANGRLPLSTSSIKNVAMIGPNSDATKTMQGNYNGVAPFLISPVQGVSTYSKTTQAKGCNDVACKDTSGFDDATKAASAADVAVVVVGIDQSQESEGHDRTSIALPGHQNDLVAAVAKASKHPIVVVVMTGGAVDLSVIRATPNVGAIVWCGYPGQSGGQAMADVLFGTYNPGGRLPYTIYPAAFTNTSMFDRHMRPNKTSGNPGRTYRFYTGQAVYEYGTGLSYTTFSYSNTTAKLTVPRATVDAYLASDASTHRYFRGGLQEADHIVITVKNTGKVAGSDVVQVRRREVPSQERSTMCACRGCAAGCGSRLTVASLCMLRLFFFLPPFSASSRRPPPDWTATPSSRSLALSAFSCSPASRRASRCVKGLRAPLPCLHLKHSQCPHTVVAFRPRTVSRHASRPDGHRRQRQARGHVWRVDALVPPPGQAGDSPRCGLISTRVFSPSVVLSSACKWHAFETRVSAPTVWVFVARLRAASERHGSTYTPSTKWKPANSTSL